MTPPAPHSANRPAQHPFRTLLSIAPFTWRDRLAVLIAVLGLAIPMALDFHYVDRLYWVGSDFKTLYASTALFVHGCDAFAVQPLLSVYRANHVILPPSLFGHMPVYPPFTLALLAPLGLMPAVPALDISLALTVILIGFALLALLRTAAEQYGLCFGWRLLILGLFAGSPLLTFPLDLGNVSVPVACLSILALCSPFGWPAALWLTLAVLLKPHLALWVVLAFGVAFGPFGRRTALRAAALSTAFAVLTGLVLALSGRLMPLLLSFRAMLTAETASGSMSPMSHELLPVGAQILSIQSLLGFAIPHPRLLMAVSLAAVLTLLGIVWRALAQAPTRSAEPARRTLATAALVAIGLIATYHRTHDAVLLSLFMPWLIAGLRRNPRSLSLWAVVALYLGECIGFFQQRLLSAGGSLPQTNDHFLIVRQAPLCALLLAVVLVWLLAQDAHLQPESAAASLPEQKKAA